jgi:small multidrug resistance family-3 protein
MTSVLWFCFAAVCEIAGCFSFWAWLRSGKHAWWAIPGTIALILFAWILTRVDAAFAGRAYAAYGGIYVVASILWLWGVEKAAPDRYDMLGAALCIAGTGVIIFAPR